MDDPALHPLLARFWQKQGSGEAKNNSMTEPDFRCTFRLDPPNLIQLDEESADYYTMIYYPNDSLKGTFTPLSLDGNSVELEVSGTDAKGKPVSGILYIDEKYVCYTKKK